MKTIRLWPRRAGMACPLLTIVRFLTCLLLLEGGMERAGFAGAPEEVSPPEMTLNGKVVCLGEEMQSRYEATLPANHEHLYGFKASDGKYYTLLRTRYSEAIFTDARIRERELILKGRLFPNSQLFEAITLRTRRDGV